MKRHIQTHRTGKRNKITGLEEDADIDDMLKDEIDQMDEMGEMRDMGDMDENEHMERMERMERMEGRVKPEQISKCALLQHQVFDRNVFVKTALFFSVSANRARAKSKEYS